MYGLCAHVVEHSCRAKGFSCRRGAIFLCAACHRWIKEAYFLLGSENFFFFLGGGLEEMEMKTKKEGERTRATGNAEFVKAKSLVGNDPAKRATPKERERERDRE